RLLYRPATPEQIAFFNASGAVSAISEMRAMARPLAGDQRSLVELKAVDRSSPLYGTAQLQPVQPLEEALAQRNADWGAVADANRVDGLGLRIGDRLGVGARE